MPESRRKTAVLILLAMAGGASAAEPVSELGQGITSYNSRDFTGAISHLRAARDLTALSDYVTYHLAYSEVLTGDVDGALALLNAYRMHPVESSPLAGKITLLYSRALLDKREPDLATKALNNLQNDQKLLPQPDGDFAFGLAYEALGEQQQAALSYERAFYQYPNTDLAEQASSAIDRLRKALGKDFPDAPASLQIGRCEKWLDARQYLKARQEYTALAERLEGADRDRARVGIGKTDYLAGDFNQAFRYLKALHVTDANADAERLYYLTESSRKVSDETEMTEAVKLLGEHYLQSPWRLRALIAAGNQYLATPEGAQATALFKAAADSFPDDDSAAYAHWMVAWDAYLNDKADRSTLLREHVERYPDDSRVGTALYFLGRVAEANAKYGEARAYYDRLNTQFPHYFYAMMARQQVRDKVAEATPDTDAVMWLEDVDWPVHRDLSAAEPNTATERRIERGRLLIAAGLPDLAEAELRFGAKSPDEQPQLLALELAKSADSPYRALRVMKSFSADYLSLPLDKAPVKFWQMLFPLPYKDDVFLYARERGLDPWDVAALIRQESEFNPVAKSRANALGLMQLRPSTGRMVGRQQGMNVPASLLFNPGVSIKLGTEYLRQQLDNWDGDWYRTLAAYNAGPGRVRQWLASVNHREPIEFLESIPFNETREYVQAVLRNADIYRELYSKEKIPVLNTPVPPVKMASLVKPAVPSASSSSKRTAVSTAKKSSSAKKPAVKKKATPQRATAQDKPAQSSAAKEDHDPA